MKCRSEWHSPAKAVRTSTSRARGFCRVTSSIVSGSFAACRTAAFMGCPLLLRPRHCHRATGSALFCAGGIGCARSRYRRKPMPDLLVTEADGVATLTMNRPDSLNALGGDMLTEMLAALTRIAGDMSVGCVVLTGAG